MDISKSEHKEIISYLQARTDVRLRNLTEMAFGDYCWLRNNETEAIERKEIKDFITSKFNGRLVIQIENCLQEYNKVDLLIEGVWGSTPDGKLVVYKKTNRGMFVPDKFSPKVQYKDVIKAILSMRRYVEIIPTLDHQQSAEAILALSNGIRDADISRPIKRRAMPVWTRDKQVTKLMNLVDRIPEKVAIALIRKYGSIGQIINILNRGGDQKLLEIDGVGEGLVANIRKAVWDIK